MDDKETKPKLKRTKASSSRDTQLQEKPIKIKLTAKETHLSGSEDEDEPEPTIEQPALFRLPPGPMCDRFRDCVKRREIPEDVKIRFEDNRHGNFLFEGQKYDLTLVDLPTILESQKTLDKKQCFKTGDISQMILVQGGPGEPAFPLQNKGRHAAEQYMYPDGITPPLKDVRRRRFRKRQSKRDIEQVEREVERLLEVDATAEDVQYMMFDNREMEHEGESDTGGQDVEVDEGDGESESDEDLVAAIDRDLELEADQEDDDEDNEDEEDEEDSEDDDDDNEVKEKRSEIEQKQQEISEIEDAIRRKTSDVQAALNPVLKKRFEKTIDDLKKELALKKAHLAEMQTIGSQNHTKND